MGGRASVIAPAIGAGGLAALAFAVSDAPWAMMLAAPLGAALGAWLGRPGVVDTERRAASPEPKVDDNGPLAPGAGRALLEALPIGVILIGHDRTIRFINKSAAQTFGTRMSEGMPASSLRASRLLDLVDQAFETDLDVSAEFALTRQGDMYLKARAHSLGEHGHDNVLVSIEDRTQSRRANDLHRDFVANASHELKTPLAAIAGIIETLLGHARDDAKATERFLGIMQSQATRMNRLVEDLLSLNRIEVNERLLPSDRNDIDLIIAEVIETLRPFADRVKVAITDERTKGPHVVLSERNEMFQLFQNLIDNAIKYGGSDSTVRISTQLDPGRQPGMIGIAIQDQGPGIAREHIPRLTERFYRVSVSRSREKGGTGLGLAIVKHILNRHRGRIEIESQVGNGARFTVWLPLVQNAPADSVPVTERTLDVPVNG